MHAGFGALRENMVMNIRGRYPGQGRTPECLADIGRFGIADAMYAPVVLRFQTYEVALAGAARDYAEAVLALPALQAWVAGARRKPGESRSSVSTNKPMSLRQ
jgi:glutathione S-transferase